MDKTQAMNIINHPALANPSWLLDEKKKPQKKKKVKRKKTPKTFGRNK